MEFTAGQNLQLSPASTQFDLIGDFTIEAWIYPTSYLDGSWTGASIFDARVNGGTDAPWAVGISYAGNLAFWDGTLYPGNGVVELNVWTHVAYVRYGADLNFYINGVLDATGDIGTGPISPGLTQPVVGSKDIAGPYGTVGNISNLRIVVGVAVYTSAFTPSTSPLTVTQPANFNGNPSSVVPYDNTVLLLNSDDNGFNFLDRSKNNFTLIGPNMPLPSAMSPFIGSISFNGTSDYLIVPSNTGFDQNGIFTWECWFYPTYIAGGYLWGESQYGFMGLGIGSGGIPGKLYVDMCSVGPVIISNTTITANSWYHVALVYDGTNTKLYLNGILEGTYSGGGAASGAPLWIGNYNNGSLYYTGYISNFRIVKGVAVYTSNFSVPPNVLTSVQGANINGFPSSAISSTQTSLLLSTPNNNNSYLVDSSIYQNIVLGPLMPTPSSVVSITDGNFDGSILFNGTSDYLTVDNSGASPEFKFGAGDWTIECWVYTTASDITQGIISKIYNIGLNAGAFLLYINASNIPTLLSCANEGGSGWTIGIGITTITTNTWNHIAVTRNGNVFTIWVNGVLSDTVTSSFILSDNPGVPVAIGSADYLGNPSFLFHGNISNMRVTKGVAVYTSNFTPSRQSLTSTQSLNINGIPSAAITGTETSLLLNTPNDVNYLVDSSSYNFTVTPIGSPTASSSIPTVAVANGSSLFNGTSDYLTVASNTAFDFGTGDFTLEAWINTTAANAGDFFIISSSGAGGFFFGYNSVAAEYGWGRTAVAWDGYGGFTKTDNVWQHIAISRQGTSIRMFLNGAQSVAAQTNSTAYDLSTTSTTAGSQGAEYYFPGYMSNLRVVKGLAVYTGTFTVPTAPFTNIQDANVNGNPSAAITGSQTSLLLNTYNSNINRVDNSTHNFLVSSPNTPIPDSSAPTFTNGSSLYNGNYYVIPYSEYGNLLDQNGAWTIEAWVYLTGVGNAGTILWGMNGVFWGVNWSANIVNRFVASAPYIGGITSINEYSELNTWYHVALSSDGTTTRLFVNGNLEGSFNGTGGVVGFPGQNPLLLGNGFNGPYTYEIVGNLSNFRVVKGVAVYTTNFTPPTNDLTAVQEANINGYPSAAITGFQTSLLLNSTNNILNNFDSSTHQLFVGCTTNPVPAAWNPYNLGSILFHDGCYLQTNNSTVFNFDTNDFTIETWAYWATAKTGNETIFEGNSVSGIRLIFGISDTGVRLYMYDGSGGEFGCSYAFSVDTWYHIAVVRLGGNISIYVNGTLANTPFVDSKVWAFTVETIGKNSDGVEPYTGDISNLRIVNGTAVYTGNFTTPTQSLNVSQNAGTNINPVTPYQTSLLLNTIDSPNNLLDSSIYNLTLSIAGTPTAVINNPFGPL
jgi:hypothetical protein